LRGLPRTTLFPYTPLFRSGLRGMTTTSAPLPPPESPEAAAALAEASGLRQVGVRPTLREYVKETWRRREFAQTLARSTVFAENQDRKSTRLNSSHVKISYA